MRKKIPVSEPDISPLEKEYLNKALDSGWISSSGEFVEKFQNEWAQLCGTSHSLAVSNGTVALHLILAGLGLGPGDEVIVPSLTFIASVNAIHYVGATPIFCDVNLGTWCIDIESIESLISEKTRAVLCVDLYGNPCDLVELKAFCDNRKIILIDDAAEAPFAKIGEVPAASLSEAASFSFYGNKILSSGEGGAVVTSNPALFERMKLLRDQGMDPNRRYFFTEIGFNYRLTNLQCALLCAQIDRKDEMMSQRLRIYDRYNDYFSSSPFVRHQVVGDTTSRSPWLYTFLVMGDTNDLRDTAALELSKRGIETRPMFIPIHTLPPYRHSNNAELPNSMEIARTGISLPTSSVMTDDEVDFVATNFIEVCEKLER